MRQRLGAARTLLALGAVALGVGVATWPTAGPAAADTSVSATVGPRGDLRDGQTVAVRWSGATPGRPVNVFQCANPPATPTCDVAHGRLGLADPSGSGTTSIVVHGRVPGRFSCVGGSAACVVVVNEGSSTDPTRNAVVPIAFATTAPAPTAAPAPGAQVARGGVQVRALAAAGGLLVLLGVAFAATSRRPRFFVEDSAP